MIRSFVVLAAALAFVSAACVTPDGDPSMKDRKPDDSRSCPDCSKAAPKDDGIVLPNGMKVILTENHAYPMICSVVVVKVGSAWEPPQLAGISHMLEHYVFNGTSRRTEEQIYAEIDRASGYNNASTAKDYTAYVMMVPKENIDLALDVQTDMLFNSTIPASKLEKERGIVIEEIKKDLSSGVSQDTVFDEVFFKGTPYGRDVIGTEEIIRSITLDDLKSFYASHYSPSNMTLWVSGDFDRAEIMKKIDTYFAKYPATEPEELVFDFPAPNNMVHVVEYDGKAANLVVGVYGPSPSDPDFPAFSFSVSLFSKELDSEGFGADAVAAGIMNVGCDFMVIPGKSYIKITAGLAPGADPNKAYAAILEEMNVFAMQRFGAEVLAREKTKVKAAEVFAKEKFHFYVFTKVPYIAYGAWATLENYVAKIALLTEDALADVQMSYFRNAEFMAVALVPKSGASAGVATGPVYASQKLENGLTVLIKQVPQTDVFSMHMLFKDRSFNEPAGKMGIADMLNRVISRSGKDKSLMGALDEIGAESQFVDNPYVPFDDYYTTTGYSFIRLQALSDQAAKAVGMVASAVATPDLTEANIEAAKGEMMQALGMDKGSPTKKAGKMLSAELLPGHYSSSSVMGSFETVKSIAGDDIKAFHASYCAPDNIIVSIVTSIPKEQVVAMLNASFGGMKKFDGSRPVKPVAPAVTVAPKEFTDKSGKPQGVVMAGSVFGQVKDPSEQMALGIIGNVVSGRLSNIIRVQKGMAYSMGAGISFVQDSGMLTVSVGTSPQNIAEVKGIILDELGRLGKFNITAEELKTEINSNIGRRFMRNISSLSQAYYMGLYESDGSGYMWPDKVNGELRKLTPEVLAEIARKHLAGLKIITVCLD